MQFANTSKIISKIKERLTTQNFINIVQESAWETISMIDVTRGTLDYSSGQEENNSTEKKSFYIGMPIEKRNFSAKDLKQLSVEKS